MFLAILNCHACTIPIFCPNAHRVEGGNSLRNGADENADKLTVEVVRSVPWGEMLPSMSPHQLACILLYCLSVYRVPADHAGRSPRQATSRGSGSWLARSSSLFRNKVAYISV